MTPLAPACLAALVLTIPGQGAPHAAPQDPVPSDAARIVGRFVDADGNAAPGVELVVAVPTGQGRRTAQHVTDADGHLLVDFPLEATDPARRTLSCAATAPGAARMHWEWFDVQGGRVLDLGVVEVLPTETLLGHVTDLEGALLVDGWTVDATWALDFDAIEGRQPTRSRATIDPVTGQFRFDDLPAGEVRVTARSLPPVRTAYAKVTVRRGEAATVELVCKEVDRSRRLALVLSNVLRAPVGPRHGYVTAIGPDGQPIALQPRDYFGEQWESGEVADGSYRVAVSDPAFEAVVLEDVRPGAQVERRLRGSGRVELDVVDADTGASLAPQAVTAAYDSGRSLLRHVPVTPALGGPWPLVTGLLPGSTELTFEAPGRARTRVRVEDLAPGETRRVTVRVASQQPLRGRVLAPDGAPASGVRVALTEGVWPGYDGTGFGLGTSAMVDGRVRGLYFPPAQHVVATDERGEFALDAPSHGAWTLVVGRDPWERISATVVHPSLEPLVLTLPEAKLVRVRAQLPEGVPASQVRLVLTAQRPREPDVLEVLARHATGHISLAPDGSAPPFRVAARSVVVALHLSPESGSFAQLARRELRPVDLAGAPEVAVDFDLTRSWPTLVRLAAPWPDRVSSRARPVVTVALVPLDSPGAPPAAPRAEVDLVATADPEMQRFTGHALPGRYHVHLRGAGWSRVLSEPLEVAAEPDPERALSLPLVVADVTVLDPSGAPRAGQDIVAWTDSVTGERAAVRTDGKGVARILAPPGEVHLALEPPRIPPDWVVGRNFEERDTAAVSALVPAATVTIADDDPEGHVVRF